MPRFCTTPRGLLLAAVLSAALSILKTMQSQVHQQILRQSSSVSSSLADFAGSPRIPTTATIVTNTTMYEICFVTSVFAKDLESADRVGNVTLHRLANPTFEYRVFTNLANLEAPGWTGVVVHPPYQRIITQSRWAKFVPWQHSSLKECPVVVYMDGYTLPINSRKATERFRHAASLVQKHPFGLGQYPKRGSRIKGLAQGLVADHKDTAENVNFTMTWLQARSDFRDSCIVYLNRHFVFVPSNANYQKLSNEFWNLYSQEQGSWRDQLLWCYVVDKFHAQPVNLYRQVAKLKELFEERRDSMGYNGHTYVSDSDAQ